MKKSPLMLCLVAALLAACGEETRDGQLTLAGSTPVRIVDEGGKTVEFGAGATKVEFSAGSGHKFTVTVSQGKDKKAKFSGKAPSADDWNFSVRGKDIGQPVDFASARNVEFYGKTWRQIGDGTPCGFNGRWVTEQTYQKCNEDWNVSFVDAGTSQAVGSFHSRRENLDCFLGERNLYCRDNGPMPGPFPRRPLVETKEKVSNLSDNGVHFD